MNVYAIISIILALSGSPSVDSPQWATYAGIWGASGFEIGIAVPKKNVTFEVSTSVQDVITEKKFGFDVRIKF